MSLMSMDDIYEDCIQTDHMMCNSLESILFVFNPFDAIPWFDIECSFPFSLGSVPEFYDEYQCNSKPMMLIENCA